MTLTLGQGINHAEFGVGTVSEVLVNDRLAKGVFDGEEKIFQVNRLMPEKKNIRRGWDEQTRQFFQECLEYLREFQPLRQPFGRDGKHIQAEWREKKGYSFVDPVQSDLSNWGGILAKKGYVARDGSGLWVATDKSWQD